MTGIANLVAKPYVDPWGIGRKVNINFSDPNLIPRTTYTSQDYTDDLNRNFDSFLSNPEAIAKIALGQDDFVDGLFDDGVTKFLDGNKPIIYGSPDADNLIASNIDFSSNPSPLGLNQAPLLAPFRGNGIVLIAGNGNDTVKGSDRDDRILSGEGNDNLDGGLGDDIFVGGAGNDTIEGGSFLFGLFQGTDTAVYGGALSEYDIEFLSDDSIRISDKVAGRDDSDTLKGVDIAKFSDKSINLAPGQDIAFVIDTTGSMFDDIDAIKASASNIIDAIFDSERGFLNSRIAVVGYNDPATNTFLSFTDQPKIDDRKTAALNAINSISVGGGGDFPEAVNAGLIRALSGGAGEWREEAVARRIILFGDAPPNDTDLRAQVLELASNVGTSFSSNSLMSMSIAGDIETSSVASGLAVTRFAVTAMDTDGAPVTIPVEIFTVLIGNDPTTTADFESLAAATGGKTFNAANASEVVDALIAAIKTPINTTPINKTPIAQDDTATTQQNTAVNLPVLINDSDSDGDALAIKSFTQGSNGMVTLNDNGTSGDTTDDFLVYTPATQSDPSIGFIDSFKYTLSDGNGATSTAAVTVAVGKIENGGNGNDTLTGTPGNDRLLGGNGNDILEGGLGDDSLDAGLGDDTLTDLEGNNTFYTGEDNNVVTAGSGNDVIYAGSGRDIIDAGNGKNQIYAVEGNNLIGTGSGNDIVYAGSGSDWIFTGARDDVIYATEGNNLIAAGTGDNLVYSGSGRDLFVLVSGAGSTTIDQFQSYDHLGLIGGLSFDQLSITKNQQGNEFSTRISIASTGDLLASLKWVETSSITRNSFVDLESLGISLLNGAASRSNLAGLMTSGVETGLSVPSVLDLQQQAIASGSPLNLA
ncbi:VWA domain-containing protein [Nostoc sp. CHAB 5784]|uniref:Ig-like domain-containing protein n=1 Tax=Nostoc mirabile TaxID=2907820 RepID=UPI001E609BCB|nr:Ig-like domain-containing protein [Nostoc mirabile]MCC5665138.1 VWA domain-containing protein [Nostoc mirabile CHAB5784]